MKKSTLKLFLHACYCNYIKRCLDIIFAFMAIIILCPVMLIIAILIKIKLGSPVIFKQMRPGKDEKIFKLYKFRTMTNEIDTYGNLLPDNKRLTLFGEKLRNSSLDELPELFNILKGDMSFIGPRPLLIEYLPLYTPKQHHRHDVLPGLTGLAQVKGRNFLSWKEKFNWDIRYVKNISFCLDIYIFFETIKIVLKQEGIHAKGNATMNIFQGNNR